MITGYYYNAMLRSGRFWKHIKKLLILTLGATIIYAAWDIVQAWQDGTLSELLRKIASPADLALFAFGNIPLFGDHLWYLWAVLYDLIFFYYADKWGITKRLKVLAPLAFAVLFFAYLTRYGIYARNFLFYGLPCVMIGRMISEGGDKWFRFLNFKKGLWFFLLLFIALNTLDLGVTHYLLGITGRSIFVFTLPLAVTIMYWALRNPGFGKDTLAAMVGRKYSAYIYIIHILVGYIIVFNRDTTIKGIISSVVIFFVCVAVSWGYCSIKRIAERREVFKN